MESPPTLINLHVCFLSFFWGSAVGDMKFPPLLLPPINLCFKCLSGKWRGRYKTPPPHTHAHTSYSLPHTFKLTVSSSGNGRRSWASRGPHSLHECAVWGYNRSGWERRSQRPVTSRSRWYCTIPRNTQIIIITSSSDWFQASWLMLTLWLHCCAPVDAFQTVSVSWATATCEWAHPYMCIWNGHQLLCTYVLHNVCIIDVHTCTHYSKIRNRLSKLMVVMYLCGEGGWSQFLIKVHLQ